MKTATRVRKAKLAYQLAKATAGVGTHYAFYGKFKVEGRKNIPKNGPFLLLPYHDSMLNILELGAASQRTLIYVSRTDAFPNPIKRMVLETYMHGAETIFFARDNPSKKNLKKTYSGINWVLQQGFGLVIFPEATRNREGTVGSANPFMVKYAVNEAAKQGIHLPVIATGIDAQRKFRGEISIRFDEPAFAKDYASIDELVNGRVMPRVAQLSGRPYDPSRNTLDAERDRREREYRLSARNN